MGPYHGSDHLLVSGQERATAYQEVGEEYLAAGKYLRGAVASFVRDPVEGLVKFGWPRYNASGESHFSLSSGEGD